MDGDVDVIITDGFTGNVALKTAEGTANFIISELKQAMTGSILGKFSSLLNITKKIPKTLIFKFKIQRKFLIQQRGNNVIIKQFK